MEQHGSPKAELLKEEEELRKAKEELDQVSGNLQSAESKQHIAAALEHLHHVIYSIVKFHIEDSRALGRIIRDLKG